MPDFLSMRCTGHARTEANGGDSGHDLAELELVENGGLTGGIETDHEDAHLLLAEEAAKHLAERESHGAGERCVGWSCRRRHKDALTRRDVICDETVIFPLKRQVNTYGSLTD